MPNGSHDTGPGWADVPSKMQYDVCTAQREIGRTIEHDEGSQHVKLIIRCARPAGHRSWHVAPLLDGYISWILS